MPAVYELARQAFEIPITFPYEHLEWQFLDNPVGPFLATVAEKDGDLIGFYGTVPLHYYDRGQKAVFALALHGMTHPGYRGQGVFAAITNELHRILAARGWRVTLGFPNQNSVGVLVHRAGWQRVAVLPVHVRVLRPRAVLQAMADRYPLLRWFRYLVPRNWPVKRNPVNPGLHIRTVHRYDARVDDLTTVHAWHKVLFRSRDHVHLNWRYAACPDRAYRLFQAEEGERVVGFLVLRFMEQFGLRGGMIIDLLAEPGRVDALEALIGEAVRASRTAGMDLVACLAHGDREILRALHWRGFVRVPTGLGFKKWYFGARVNTADADPAVVYRAASWFLTFGDNDPM